MVEMHEMDRSFWKLRSSLTGLALAIGLAAIVGWVSGNATYIRLMGGFATMKMNTALAVIFLALPLLMAERLKKAAFLPLERALIGTALILGSLTLLEVIFDRSLGIDELFVSDPESLEAGQAPGRMSGITAVLIVLTGLSQLLKSLNRLPQLANAASLLALTLSFVGLCSYLFGVEAMYRFAPFESLSLNTVLAFFGLSLALMLTAPRWPELEFTLRAQGDDHLGPRLLTAVFGLPMLVALLALAGVRAGLYGQAFALAILTSVASILMAIWVTVCFRLRERMLSQRANIEARLRNQKDWFRVITENARELIMVANARNELVFVSPSFEKSCGERAQDQIGRPLFERWHPDDDRDLSSLESQVEFRFRVRDVAGNWIRMGGSLRVVDIDGEEHRILIARDLEERLDIEERLARQSRLEAIGRVAGGVAHDFNNFLTVIQGYVELVAGTPEIDEDTKDLCNQALQVSRQAAAMSRGLLTMGKGQFQPEGLIDPQGILREMEPILRHLMPGEVELIMDVKDEATPLLADPTRFRQVIMNLVVNARDAIKEEGCIVLDMRGVELDRLQARRLGAQVPGRYLRISVRDTGTGIPCEIRERIFEPFFTTKAQGKGTGLGLATVYGFVQDADGVIDLQTDPASGTTFIIHWPLNLPRSAAADESR